ncbi:MAG: hypothetical protein KBD05_00820 [Candidatus Pacebacteria bacterium]|nr:hypothetical protein [Candidatus Paceibacterota bacterium]
MSAEASRAWRKPIPQNVEPDFEPKIRFSTRDEQDAAIKRVVDEINLEIVRNGYQVNSDVNLDVFGDVPLPALTEMQLVADLCRQYLARPAEDDHFPTHTERRVFKSRHKEQLGNEFRMRFENNRFRLSLTTGLASRFKLFRDMIDPARRTAFSKRDPLYPVPQKEELCAAIDKVIELLHPINGFQERYENMSMLGNPEKGELGKLDVVDLVSEAAATYLTIVTGRPILDELKVLDQAARAHAALTRQSRTSQDS